MPSLSSPPLSFLPSPAVNNHENIRPVQSSPLSGEPAASGQTQTSSWVHTQPSNSTPMSGADALYSPFATPARATLDSAAHGSSSSYYNLRISQLETLVEEQRGMMERQQNVHNHERTCWETQKQRLLAEIDQLRLAAGEGSQPTQGHSTQLKDISNVGHGAGGQHPSLMLSKEMDQKARGPRHSSNPELGPRFWEGSSRPEPTRVFNDPPYGDTGLPAIPEHPRPALTPSPGVMATRSTSAAASSTQIPVIEGIDVSQGIDISLVQPDLDGIRLRASALPPSVVASVVSPPTVVRPTSPPKSSPQTIGSPHASPPKPPEDGSEDRPPENAPKGKSSEGDSKGKLPEDASNTLEPAKVRLTKDAGHTPNAPALVLSPAEGEEAGDSTVTPKPRLRLQPPPAPAATNATDEAGSDIDDGDIPLKGPLHLPSEGTKSPVTAYFLNALDNKLEREARASERRSDGSVPLTTVYYPSSSEPSPERAGNRNGEGSSTDNADGTGNGHGNSTGDANGNDAQGEAGASESQAGDNNGNGHGGRGEAGQSESQPANATANGGHGGADTSEGPASNTDGSDAQGEAGPSERNASTVEASNAEAGPSPARPSDTSEPPPTEASQPNAPRRRSAQLVEPPPPSADSDLDPDLQVRLKRSMNFGSAFGNGTLGSR